jgi:uncharacterized NAD(P)/FAD-binding protein YdhS
MKKIAIIGGGFTGSMTAVHLMRKAEAPVEVTIFHQGVLNKGVAYDPYSARHLLNVTTGRMSAFRDEPDSFLDWVMGLPEFRGRDRTLISKAFMPRALYGEYLVSVWKQSIASIADTHVRVKVVNDAVIGIGMSVDGIDVLTHDKRRVKVDKCALATGNQLPRNPFTSDPSFHTDPRYHRDPWDIRSVIGIQGELPVLIIGNGLTMVDTVIGLLEHGFKGAIHSISPNGFNILPHRHTGHSYTGLTDELPNNVDLRQLVSLVNKHVKYVRDFGLSAEPVIDSLRPHTQRIWRGLTAGEKELFMRRLRHLWGVARHRIPLHTYDLIQKLRMEGRLMINSGRIMDLLPTSAHILVKYRDRIEGEEKELTVSRVINCTGPETDINRMNDPMLKDLLQCGAIVQDSLKLGLCTNGNFHLVDRNGDPHKDLFTLGSNLKGELWESTAVNELREQAEQLANELLKDL